MEKDEIRSSRLVLAESGLSTIGLAIGEEEQLESIVRHIYHHFDEQKQIALIIRLHLFCFFVGKAFRLLFTGWIDTNVTVLNNQLILEHITLAQELAYFQGYSVFSGLGHFSTACGDNHIS